MNLFSISEHILFHGKLEDKLIKIDLNSIDLSHKINRELPKDPARIKKISFSNDKVKFPKKGNLFKNHEKAMALHFFANHELLAIEIMAYAILKFSYMAKEDNKFIIGLAKTLQDEQKHLKLYVSRLNDLGYEFGDFSLNDYFWRHINNFETPSHYLSVMALTFESANLDFAYFYENLFKFYQDEATAHVLGVVLKDEISHVQFGCHYLNKWKKNSKLWDYYLEHLPHPLTPERSKGINYNRDLRIKAKLNVDFVESLECYNDQFTITKRQSCKLLEK
ncbi:MAG: DUF455 family protein [Halobacteriovoraceae bacterium]|nr:DUF455 family protein [Halobacteriovoraceae bacterium]